MLLPLSCYFSFRFYKKTVRGFRGSPVLARVLGSGLSMLVTQPVSQSFMQIPVSIYFGRFGMGTVLFILCSQCAVSVAQSQLPKPSRTIYKCNIKGTVSYSDEPCLGAQRLDATPSRGVDRLSGQTRTGQDVAREIHTEQFGAALRPLHGMTTSQFVTAVRRNDLGPAVRRECNELEPNILGLEQVEKRADAVTIKRVQQDLFVLRKRYKELAC